MEQAQARSPSGEKQLKKLPVHAAIVVVYGDAHNSAYLVPRGGDSALKVIQSQEMECPFLVYLDLFRHLLLKALS